MIAKMNTNSEDHLTGQTAPHATPFDQSLANPFFGLSRSISPDHANGIDFQRGRTNQIPIDAHGVAPHNMQMRTADHLGPADGLRQAARDQLYTSASPEGTSATASNSHTTELQMQERPFGAPFRSSFNPNEFFHCEHCNNFQHPSLPSPCYGQDKGESEGGPDDVFFAGSGLAGLVGFTNSFDNVKDAKKFLGESRTTVNVEKNDVDGVEGNQQSGLNASLTL